MLFSAGICNTHFFTMRQRVSCCQLKSRLKVTSGMKWSGVERKKKWFSLCNKFYVSTTSLYREILRDQRNASPLWEGF